MDQLDQDITRFKKPAMAAVGGIAAALVIATLPAVYLEKAIGMTGISEIISAAAPPLGNTAKALIAIFAGLVSASLIFLFFNRKGEAGMGMALPKFSNVDAEEAVDSSGKPKYALPKFSLKRLLQKPRKKKTQVKDLSDLPKLRESDSHPDAPARQPIFAEKDLGAPLASKIKPFDQAAEQAAVAPEAPPVPEVTPAPFVVDKSLQSPDPEETPLDLSGQVTVPPIADPVAEAAASPVDPAPASPVASAEAAAADPQEDMSDLSISQLTDRLEAGLGRLKQLEQLHAKAALAAQPAAAQPAPSVTPSQDSSAGGISVTSTETVRTAPPALKSVEPTAEDINAKRQADMDAALKAALGTLEKMTAQR